MKGDAKVISFLNQVLAQELTAINQYFLHAKMFQNWGFASLGKKEYDGSIDEMKHADSLIERILFLDGLPNLQKLETLSIGENVKECLEADFGLEKKALGLLQEAIKYCEDVQDYVSRDLLMSILQSEEEHVDWLETQLHLIEQVGIQNFLQQQIGQ